jgi:periplasmic protein TonB
MEAKKSKEADLESKRRVFQTVGLVMISAVVLMAFTATSADVAERIEVAEEKETFQEETMEILEMEEPEPEQQQVAAPPPPAPEEIIIEEDDVELDDTPIFGEDNGVPPPVETGNGNDDLEIEAEPIVDFAEKEPAFPGGEAAMHKYIQEHVEYPELSREMGEQGTVYVQFVVNSDGTIQDVVVVKPVSDLLNKEAIRVVKSMPAWAPGEQAGKKVRVRFTLPINFRIQ